MPDNAPHNALRHIVSGAIARGESEPIVTLELPDTYAEAFLAAYVECALWSESAGLTVADDGTVTEAPDDDTSFDSHGFSAGDLTPEALESMRTDCDAFIASNIIDLAIVARDLHHESGWSSAEQSGHDFWLTRNGHGAGFWDRGYGDVGRRLSDACDPFGEVHLYAAIVDGADHVSVNGADVADVVIGVE